MLRDVAARRWASPRRRPGSSSSARTRGTRAAPRCEIETTASGCSRRSTSRIAQLVAVVGVGVQEADADRRDAAVPEPPRHGDGALLVEGPDLVALEVDPAADGLDVVGRDDPRRLDPEVGVAVAVGHRLAGDLEDELVALGRDEAERPRPCPRAACWSRRSCRGETALMSSPLAPIRSSTLWTPARKPSAGLLGVEGVFVVTSSPDSSSRATTSVNVPPVSMPIRIRRPAEVPAVMVRIQPAGRPLGRWHIVPTAGSLSGQPSPVPSGRGPDDVEGASSAPSPG